jgi:ribosomal-protein-alanine acetyltransferase
MMFQMPITIEDASIKNLDRLYEIETECFKQEAFGKQQIAHLLTGYDAISLVAKSDGEIAGFIIGIIYDQGNAFVAHILTIDVSPAYRRKGIGLQLLQEIEKLFMGKGVRACHLEVREHNLAALRLYEKSGYRKVSKLENYYGNANGIHLTKILA